LQGEEDEEEEEEEEQVQSHECMTSDKQTRTINNRQIYIYDLSIHIITMIGTRHVQIITEQEQIIDLIVDAA
jgi:hypothetical protein